MKLSIIIVNYNTVNLLRDCINNLTGINPNYEIIVVDNGSTDGSAHMVENEFSDDPRILLIKNENKGIAHANNLALKHASGKYILHLGTDAYPKPYVIKELMLYLERFPGVGIVTARLVTRSGAPDMDAHRGFPTPWAALTHFTKISRVFSKSKLLNQYFMGWLDLYTDHEIDLCISHFMLVNKQVYEDIGGWDEDFFVFGEDVDFCYRVKQHGWKIMYLGHLEVLHYKGAGVGRKTSSDIKTASNTSPETRKRMKMATVSAMKMFYKKHYARKYPVYVTFPILLSITILGLIRSKLSK